MYLLQTKSELFFLNYHFLKNILLWQCYLTHTNSVTMFASIIFWLHKSYSWPWLVPARLPLESCGSWWLPGNISSLRRHCFLDSSREIQYWNLHGILLSCPWLTNAARRTLAYVKGRIDYGHQWWKGQSLVSFWVKNESRLAETAWSQTLYGVRKFDFCKLHIFHYAGVVCSRDKAKERKRKREREEKIWESTHSWTGGR